MYSDNFEVAFSHFLDCHEYDEAQEYLFQVARAAFAAGWKAAAEEFSKKTEETA